MHEKEAGVGPFKKSIQNWSVNDLHTFGRKIFEFVSAFFQSTFISIQKLSNAGESKGENFNYHHHRHQFRTFSCCCCFECLNLWQVYERTKELTIHGQKSMNGHPMS